MNSNIFKIGAIVGAIATILPTGLVYGESDRSRANGFLLAQANTDNNCSSDKIEKKYKACTLEAKKELSENIAKCKQESPLAGDSCEQLFNQIHQNSLKECESGKAKLQQQCSSKSTPNINQITERRQRSTSSGSPSSRQTPNRSSKTKTSNQNQNRSQPPNDSQANSENTNNNNSRNNRSNSPNPPKPNEPQPKEPNNSSKKCDSLQRELRKVVSQIATTEQKIKELEKKIESLEKDRELVNAEIQNLQEIKNELTQKIKEITVEGFDDIEPENEEERDDKNRRKKTRKRRITIKVVSRFAAKTFLVIAMPQAKIKLIIDGAQLAYEVYDRISAQRALRKLREALKAAESDLQTRKSKLQQVEKDIKTNRNKKNQLEEELKNLKSKQNMLEAEIQKYCKGNCINSGERRVCF